MSHLKRSFFWGVLYLGFIFVLGGADYVGRPIINFASYFYLAVMVAVPVTLFFPFVARISPYIPLLLWAGVYLVLLQILNRRLSTTDIEFSVIILEFVLLEVGVWFSYQLALQINHAESVMDALALGAFPNRVHDIESESQRIKVELTRSRRYHRPLSVLVAEIEFGEEKATREVIKSIQHDLMNRFTLARVAQIIDDRIRQTDLVLRDRRGRFVVLCPETDLANVALLGKRISQAVEERVGLRMLCGGASFPDEAVTFDDLLMKAHERVAHPAPVADQQVAALNSH